MSDNPYYSQRKRRATGNTKIDLSLLKELFSETYNRFFEDHYFAEHIGSNEQQEYSGKLGDTYGIERRLFIELRKKELWPIRSHIDNYNEEDLFDIIVFCHRYVSKPINEHTEIEYDSTSGQNEFREALNKHLNDYDEGYELDVDGQIKLLMGHGLDKIFHAVIPSDDIKNVVEPLTTAVKKYRDRHSNNEDRKNAVRELADVLEYLRPQVKKVITKADEGDLFNIANNFGIRHHNDIQKTDYNKGVWHSWMFYFYLATIHAVLRLIKENDKQSS